VPGEPKPEPEQRDGKKRYSSSDLRKVHDHDGAEKWPEWEDEDTPPENEDPGPENGPLR
jgi:hypothetical protein